MYELKQICARMNSGTKYVFNMSKVYACNTLFPHGEKKIPHELQIIKCQIILVLQYIFLELRVFADFVDHVCSRDDSLARRNDVDHLQCANNDQVRTHVIEDLMSGETKATIFKYIILTTTESGKLVHPHIQRYNTDNHRSRETWLCFACFCFFKKIIQQNEWATGHTCNKFLTR
jgi:hypothetical protein